MMQLSPWIQAEPTAFSSLTSPFSNLPLLSITLPSLCLRREQRCCRGGFLYRDWQAAQTQTEEKRRGHGRGQMMMATGSTKALGTYPRGSVPGGHTNQGAESPRVPLPAGAAHASTLTCRALPAGRSRIAGVCGCQGATATCVRAPGRLSGGEKKIRFCA